MNLNASNLSHPRMQWNLEAAMWRAKERSLTCTMGIAAVRTTAGHHLVGVMHDRAAVPAFSFWKGGKDVTQQILKTIRGFKK